jgi:lycopene cyclase domain-containing protein
MSLYFTVEICAIAVPLALSFDRKVAFYKKWSFLLPSIFINALIFTALDIHFTKSGIWGFNPRYHSTLLIAGLPLEEILFFIIIPYSSMFIHYVFISYFPHTAIQTRATFILSSVFIIIFISVAIFRSDLAYSSFYSLLAAGILFLVLIVKPSLLSRYYLTFIIILVPFLIVNSILTGNFTDESVFLYNENEISGVRLFSIPVEDTFFGFSLVLQNLFVAEMIKKIIRPNESISGKD